MIPPRRDGESELQYHKRLVNGKLVDKSLADIDYSELAEPLYGQQYSSDFTRRMMYGSKYTLALLEKEAYASDCQDELVSLDEKRRELQEERYKLSSAKIELQRERRQTSHIDLFLEQLKEEAGRLEPPEIIPIADEDCDSEWVLGLGDIHYGAVFNSAHNSYSRAECKRRFATTLGEVKKMCLKQRINKLTILNVADSVQGILRLSDLQLNDISVVDCVVEITRLIATFLNELSSVCEITYYHIPAANHTQTRPLGSKASEIVTEDLERIIVNWISDLLMNNDRVIVADTLGCDYVDFDIAGYKCIAMHGHQIKNVDSCVEQLSNMHRKMYDYVFLGHRHSANERIVAEGDGHNVEILTCPSFVGSDPYADKLLTGSKAMVKMFEFNSKHGHIGSKNIILN